MFLPLAGFGQNDFLTGKGLNCRYWKAATQADHTSYIAGALDGVSLALSEANVHYDMGKIAPDSLRVPEIAEAMTAICNRPENAPMMVMFGFKLVALKAYGVSPAEFSKQEAIYRDASRLLAKPKQP